MVTTIIPTIGRDTLWTRALPSVMAQDGDWECIVVGDGVDLADRVASLDDPRITFLGLPRTPLPDDPVARWRVQGTVPFNAGLDRATGDWVSYLADDDEYVYDHHAILRRYISDRVDVIHARSTTVSGVTYGRPDPCTTMCVQGAYIMRASLGLRARTEPGDSAWDAMWWQDAIDAGFRFRFVESIVHHYYPEPATHMYHGS